VKSTGKREGEGDSAVDFDEEMPIDCQSTSAAFEYFSSSASKTLRSGVPKL